MIINVVSIVMLIGICGNIVGMEVKKLIFVYIVNRLKKCFKDF